MPTSLTSSLASGPSSSGINNEEIDRMLQQHGIAPPSKVLDAVKALPSDIPPLSAGAGLPDVSSLPSDSAGSLRFAPKPKQLSVVTLHIHRYQLIKWAIRGIRTQSKTNVK